MMQSIKMIGVSIWVFVNLTMFGLLVYIYLLWSVYWKTSATPRGPILETSVHKMAPAYSPWQGKLFLATADGKPRYYWNDTEMLSRLSLPTDKIQNKIETYKNQLIVKLRQSQLDTANVLKGIELNTYNVQYQGGKKATKTSAKTLICEMKKLQIRFLTKDTEPFRSLDLGKYFPSDAGDAEKWSRRLYNSCAVVASSGSLFKSSLGKEIGKFRRIVTGNLLNCNNLNDMKLLFRHRFQRCCTKV